LFQFVVFFFGVLLVKNAILLITKAKTANTITAGGAIFNHHTIVTASTIYKEFAIVTSFGSDAFIAKLAGINC
jgi:hypothetical protein